MLHMLIWKRSTHFCSGMCYTFNRPFHNNSMQHKVGNPHEKYREEEAILVSIVSRACTLIHLWRRREKIHFVKSTRKKIRDCWRRSETAIMMLCWWIVMVLHLPNVLLFLLCKSLSFCNISHNLVMCSLSFSHSTFPFFFYKERNIHCKYFWSFSRDISPIISRRYLVCRVNP